MTKKTKQKIIDLLYENYYAYYEFPMHGLIPDWYLRYWELHNSILEYLEEDSNETA